jgi:pilus assembly protein CpaF
MPVVKSHQKLFYEKYSAAAENVRDMNTIISAITNDILRECPALVAEVSAGRIHRSVLETAVIKDIDAHRYHFGFDRDELIRKVFDFMFGYGELQPYIDEEDITDIDGTFFNQFVIKRHGVRSKIPVDFGSEKIFDTYCKLVAVRNGGILNENDSHCRVTDERTDSGSMYPSSRGTFQAQPSVSGSTVRTAIPCRICRSSACWTASLSN